MKPKRPLSAQDKLALMMTAARSQRALASFLGVSHQKLGRWLREGEHGGVKAIPADELTRRGIDEGFHAYAKIAKDRARMDGLPFDETHPTFWHRLPLRTGAPGERVIADHTQYIRPELRHEILSAVHRSRMFHNLSVRSTVALSLYFKQADSRQRGEGRRSDTKREHRRSLEKDLHLGVSVRPMFTPLEGFGRATSRELAIDNVERLLRQRHEPAVYREDEDTGEELAQKGTAVADQFLLQLYPQNHVHTKATPKPRPAKARRKPQGRGNK